MEGPYPEGLALLFCFLYCRVLSYPCLQDLSPQEDKRDLITLGQNFWDSEKSGPALKYFKGGAPLSAVLVMLPGDIC